MKTIACFLSLFAVILLIGCGDSGPPASPTAKVSGTVNMDGKPMEGGEVRFSAPGLPGKALPVSAGAFSGEVYVGKNQVEVVYEVEGKTPHPMEPGKFLKENKVDPKFSGPGTTLSADVGQAGASDLKFEVTGS